MLTPKHKYYNISIGWTTHLMDVAVSPFAGPTPGPAIPVSCDPLELFSAFFDDTCSLGPLHCALVLCTFFTP